MSTTNTHIYEDKGYKNEKEILWYSLNGSTTKICPFIVLPKRTMGCQYVNPHKWSTKRTLCGIALFKLNTFFSHVLHVPSIVLCVFCIRRVYRGSISFSLVLILCICAYLGIKGDWFFSDLGFFLALVLCTNWCTAICITCLILHELECIKFVCNKFVLVLFQIDLIQFEFSNCIRSICTKKYYKFVTYKLDTFNFA